MTRRTAGANSVTISTPRGGSVPIVSQTEIKSMKTALSLNARAHHDDGAHRAAARAESEGRAARARTPTSRAAHSARRRRALRTPSPSRAMGRVPGDGSRAAATACGADGAISDTLSGRRARLDSERSEPFVDTARLFAEKWHQ